MPDDSAPRDFIREIVAKDLAEGKNDGRVATRFPPEPNGFLHIGHATAICLDFEVAAENDGVTTLRMDDTNPTTEDVTYAEGIERDIHWLGFEWEPPTRYASDYFEQLFQLAIRLIEDGKAYVDSQSLDEIRENRGTVTEPGVESPHRERSVEESLDLFRRMRAGEFEDGTHVLRAKIDMSSPNMLMRDPLLYRIRHAHHYRTGDDWPIYPMYDWAHPLGDAIEGVTHSLCTLEFENNRELYDWAVDHTRPEANAEPGSWHPRPRQYEFARANLDYAITSKRKLLQLVEDDVVTGWDDPRMPTLTALRRRGVPPEAIRAWCRQVGISRADKRADTGSLEFAIRGALNRTAPRVMAVLDPLKLLIENHPEDEEELLGAPYYPRDVGLEGSRDVPFGRELLIERSDFDPEPPDDFYRLAPGREVRLRYGYLITCTGFETDPETGEVTEVRASYDPETRGGNAPDGRKVRGTIHWVSAAHAIPTEVRLYDRLFSVPDPTEGVEDFRENLNPVSIRVMRDARIEPSVGHDPPETTYQFERQGYFIQDSVDSNPDALVFNRIVSLRDTWAKRKGGAPGRRQERGGKRAAARAAEAAAASTGTAPKTSERAAGGALPRARADDRAQARAENTELAEAFVRYRDELGLDPEIADLLTEDATLVKLFEDAVIAGATAAAAASWIVHELRTADADSSDLRFGGVELAELLDLLAEGAISHGSARAVFATMLADGGDPKAIVEALGLARIADRDALAPIVYSIIDANPDEAKRFRAGQEGLKGFFVGQVMRETGGAADPALVQKLVEEALQG